MSKSKMEKLKKNDPQTSQDQEADERLHDCHAYCDDLDEYKNFSLGNYLTQDLQKFPIELMLKEQEIIDSGIMYSKMVRQLLRLYFTPAEMLHGSMSGRVNVEFRRRGYRTKPRIDPAIVERIVALVAKKFGKYQEGSIRHAITLAMNGAKHLKENKKWRSDCKRRKR